MSTLKRVLFTIFILYTFAGKLYTTVFFFQLQGFNLSDALFVHLTNITILSILLMSLLIVWEIWYNKINFIILKYKYVFKVSIIIVLIIQLFLSLFDILTKNPNVNQFKVLLVGDLPNLFSIIISIIMIIALPNKKERDNVSD